jgi:hypothetical protein
VIIYRGEEEENVVIKDDSIHCCPHGYTCNIKENQCEKGVLIPWFTNKQATPLNLPSKLILSHSSSSLSTIQCSGLNFSFFI